MIKETPPYISVIVVNYNSGPLLQACLQSLSQQDFIDFEVLVVDNASDDSSFQDAQATIPTSDSRFYFISETENLGFAAANNRAAQQARGSWLALLNPDAVASVTWLSTLAKAASDYPDTDMFGSLQIRANDPTRLDGCGDCYHFTGFPYRGHEGHSTDLLPKTGEVFGPCAAAGFYLKSLFLELGGFYEPFFCYCEDVDLAFRMRLMGSHCIQLQEAIVHHHGSAIANNVSGFTIYHGTRNAMWMLIKNMPLPVLIVLFPFHLATHLALLVKAIGRPSFLPRLKGIIHGLKGIPRALLARRHVERTIPTSALLRSMVWSPRQLIKRDAYIMDNSGRT